MRSGSVIAVTTVRIAVLAVVAALGLALTAAPAAAHGQLAMSDPVQDSTVDQARADVALYFTEQPASFAWFTVTAPSGQRVDGGWRGGEPKRLDKPVQEYFLVDGKFEPKVYNTGFPALVAVSHWPEQGQYVVAYQSVASDGEAVKGQLRFTYSGPVTPAPAGWTAPTAGPSEALTRALNKESAPAAAAPTAGPTQQPQQAAPPPAPATPFVLTDWLIPALLIVGVGAMVWLAARREPVQPEKKRRKAALR
ncbi:copper resistance protein CopC [Dactylosporangium aurantiacum]|uniref:Copper resistance protein CopC n=1 Tax=Dactylosporangium aurantiacum TaxID=35754 RepID=A0A9Q9IN98_9ACTN|nr:copper resistance protein CopC [Dactylosporangium aurantiacum]MDG6104083.1 copper resistance protein CopC [Dactylosporangium aurantiacum]UWZ56902.1 copper resistance protein CopC [Dactylosporangium aurantiacum]